MRSRFEFQAPGLIRRAALTIKAPLHCRSEVRPWVFDKKSGVRFQLAKDEHAALKPVTSRIGNGSSSLPVTVAFEQTAESIMNRRRGHRSEWNRLAQRTPADWDRWLSGGLRRLRW
jgi:hypothetical protein